MANELQLLCRLLQGGGVQHERLRAQHVIRQLHLAVQWEAVVLVLLAQQEAMSATDLAKILCP